MIGYYNYTTILTYLSLISALLGTHMAICGYYVNALICLLVCGVLDSFDGIVARTKKDRTEEEKRFGIQIDSLVDMYSFGIFPVIIGYSIGLKSLLWFFVLCVYAICAVSRLAYFNVAEELRQQQTTEKRKYYQGLPVTMSSLIFPLVYLTSVFFKENMVYVYGGTLFVVAMAFVIDFKVIKPGLKGIFGLIVVGILIMLGLIAL